MQQKVRKELKRRQTVEKDRSRDKKQVKISSTAGSNSGGTSTPTKVHPAPDQLTQQIHTQLEAVLAERRKKT